jgi:outer membrane protein assembly factor BamB
VTEEGKSGKRIVAILLALVLAAGLIAWLGAAQLEKNNRLRQQSEGEVPSAKVLNEGVLYEAAAGDPGIVIARDVASGKELWRTELGSITAAPVITVDEGMVYVQIAGTPWMKLDRSTGEPIE